MTYIEPTSLLPPRVRTLLSHACITNHLNHIKANSSGPLNTKKVLPRFAFELTLSWSLPQLIIDQVVLFVLWVSFQFPFFQIVFLSYPFSLALALAQIFPLSSPYTSIGIGIGIGISIGDISSSVSDAKFCNWDVSVILVRFWLGSWRS